MVLVYTLFPDILLLCRPGWLQTLGSSFASACQMLVYATTLALVLLIIIKVHLKIQVADVESFCIGHSLGLFFALFFLLCCFSVMVMLNSKFELGCVCLFRGSFTELVPYLNCLEKLMIEIICVLICPCFEN